MVHSYCVYVHDDMYVCTYMYVCMYHIACKQDHNMISMKVTALLHTVSSAGLIRISLINHLSHVSWHNCSIILMSCTTDCYMPFSTCRLIYHQPSHCLQDMIVTLHVFWYHWLLHTVSCAGSNQLNLLTLTLPAMHDCNMYVYAGSNRFDLPACTRVAWKTWLYNISMIV